MSVWLSQWMFVSQAEAGSAVGGPQVGPRDEGADDCAGAPTLHRKLHRRCERQEGRSLQQACRAVLGDAGALIRNLPALPYLWYSLWSFVYKKPGVISAWKYQTSVCVHRGILPSLWCERRGSGSKLTRAFLVCRASPMQ